MDTLNREALIKKRLKKNQKLSLMGFVVVTASAIVAFYTFPSLSTAGWVAIIFAFITALCWFLPLAMAAAEMATVRGWTHGGIFTWVRRMIGPRWGFLVNWLQFQVSLGFVAMIFFVLTSFGFSFAGTEGYNFINSLKLGTTLNQATNVNYSPDYNRSTVFAIGMVLLIGIMALSLLGQKNVHKLGQLGFTLGILTPFLIVTAFSIYTIATMKDPLSLIGISFIKSHHFDLTNMGSSYTLNKRFASSTVMASFMAFMFSLHGVEVSAVAANRMKNPSKMYPRAMSIVVALALICAIVGSITISMTVPTSTLSFTGGLVQSMMFTMSVEGVTVNINGAEQHFKTLADAFSQIEHQHGALAAEALLNQFVYGPKDQQILNPLDGSVILNKISVSQPSESFKKGIQALSFFIGFGVFAEISVWTSNLSTGLCYGMEKAHFSKVMTYKTKTGAPLMVTLFNIVMIVGIFAIFTYSYQSLDSYAGKTFADVLTPISATTNTNFAGLDSTKLAQVQTVLNNLGHYDATHGFVTNASDAQIDKALLDIQKITGFEVVANGTPASETNIAFISNVIMQISTYFVGYTIFLISYMRFAFTAKKIVRQFKLKSIVLQMIFAILALCTTLFAAVATYLPAAPELYPGKEVYFLFLCVSLPTYVLVVLLGLTMYQINKAIAKKRGLVISEKGVIEQGTLEQLDLIENKDFYIKASNWEIYQSKVHELDRAIEQLYKEYYETQNVELLSDIKKLQKQLKKQLKLLNNSLINKERYEEMLSISHKINELYAQADEILAAEKVDNEKYDSILIEIEEHEEELYKQQYRYYQEVCC